MLVKHKLDKTEQANDKIVQDAVAEQAIRIQVIVEGIDELTDDQYTGGGLPELRALQDITGYADITGKERDDAYAIYKG